MVAAGKMVREHCGVRPPDALPVSGVDEVQARADHLVGCGAGLGEGVEDDSSALRA